MPLLLILQSALQWDSRGFAEWEVLFGLARRAALSDNCRRRTLLTSLPLCICCQIPFHCFTNYLKGDSRPQFCSQDVVSPLWIGIHAALILHLTALSCPLSFCPAVWPPLMDTVLHWTNRLGVCLCALTYASPLDIRNSFWAVVVLVTLVRSGLQLLSETEACWDMWAG